MLDIEEEDSFQQETALMVAAGADKTETIRLLLDRGANINQKNKQGETTLMRAASGGRKEIVNFLLNRGASVDQTDDEGNTALMHAAGANAYYGKEIVDLLLNRGASVDYIGNGGTTALMIAAYKGRERIVKILLDCGADFSKTTVTLGQEKNALELSTCAMVNLVTHGRYHVTKQFIISKAFTANDMILIKEHIDKILEVCTPLEKAISLKNIVTVTNGQDAEFIKRLLDTEIPKIEPYITAKSFRKLEQIKMYEMVQSLKEQVKALGITSDTLNNSLKDDHLLVKLKEDYDKISEVSGRCISKEKIDKNPTQNIISYFETDDDLENVCIAVLDKDTSGVLKQFISQKEVVENVPTSIAENNAAVLGAEEVAEDASV